MTVQNPTVPRPTWHGSPGDVVARYTAFVRRQLLEIHRTRPRQLQEQIQQLETRISSLRQGITDYQTQIVTARTKILQLETMLAGIDDKDIQEYYSGLIEIPEVIGTRIGRYGELIILVRPRDDRGTDYGDFELDADFFTSSMFTFVRRPEQAFHLLNCYLYDNKNVGRVEIATYVARHIASDALRAMLQTYDFRGIVQLFCESITGYQGDAFVNPTERPVAHWEKFEPDGVRAIRQLESATQVLTVQEEIARQQQRIQNHEGSIRNSRESAVASQTELRLARAELAKLRKNGDEPEADMEAIRKELRFMTTGIPGIMGMRFEPDGTPVLHLRSSFTVAQHRYDLGDFELFLRPHRTSQQGVIEIHQTRRPLGAQLVSFWHPSYPGGGPDIHDWFCFGSRQSTLEELFCTGEFGHFLNVAVNSMNSVNVDYVDEHARLSKEIPFEEVWTNKPRRRPRRVPVRELGHVAITAL